jgi:hypothetical protein
MLAPGWKICPICEVQPIPRRHKACEACEARMAPLQEAMQTLVRTIRRERNGELMDGDQPGSSRFVQ